MCLEYASPPKFFFLNELNFWNYLERVRTKITREICNNKYVYIQDDIIRNMVHEIISGIISDFKQDYFLIRYPIVSSPKHEQYSYFLVEVVI